jgi:polysaccharide pyruvyl transferase WcaK-like protein
MLTREWPPGRPRILVSDAWLANGGDGAIALATQARLTRLAPEAAVLHAAYQCDLLAEHYPQLALVPPLAALLGVIPPSPEMAGWEPADAERIVSAADLVLCQGGGYAMEVYDPGQRLRAWDMLVERGVPVGFGAQTVGRFLGSSERSMLARVYGAAVVIALREGESVRNLLELGVRHEQLLVTADEAFSLPPPPPPDPPRRGIACVMSRDLHLRADGDLGDLDRSVAALAGLVTELVALSAGEGVTLLSTYQGLGGLERGLEDDGEVAAEVVAALPDPVAARVRLPAGYLAPAHCAQLIGEHRGLVTTRMHPAIFAVTLGVPTVLVTQAYKASAMFRALGLGDVVVDDIGAAAARLSRQAEAPDATLARERCALNDAVFERLLAAAGP